MLALPPSLHPWPIGVGPRYHPAPLRRSGRPVGMLRCASGGRSFRVHLELFAHRRVVIVPPAIGAGPGCRYPLWTSAPTGVVSVRGRRTLGDLFAVWGRRLGPGRLLSFRGRVSVYVGGRLRRGDPGMLMLTPRQQVVVEVGGYVAPHPAYVFPRT